jgi:PIN domain nuclease of toxin-antitoxin system
MRRGDLLLDTNAALWTFSQESLADEAMQAMDAAWAANRPIFVSKITAWEIGMLVRKQRITLPMPPLRWFDEALETPGFELADLTPEILIEASFLPDGLLRDPADQIMVATARMHGLQLVTRDGLILRAAQAGHLQAIEC